MPQVLVDVNGLDALKAAKLPITDLRPGASGQIILTGPGLGIAADVAGAEAAWRSLFGAKGIAVKDVHGEGLSTAVVDWNVPTAQAGQASMGNPLAPVILVGAIVAVLLFLGWLVLGRIQVLLFGEGGDGGLGLAGLLPLAAIVVLAILLLANRRRA